MKHWRAICVPLLAAVLPAGDGWSGPGSGTGGVVHVGGIGGLPAGGPTAGKTGCHGDCTGRARHLLGPQRMARPFFVGGGDYPAARHMRNASAWIAPTLPRWWSTARWSSMAAMSVAPSMRLPKLRTANKPCRASCGRIAACRCEIDGANAGDRIFLALADSIDSTAVSGGENKGRQLRHVAVCREIRQAGKVPPGGAFSRLIQLPQRARRQRVIVWTQSGDAGAVSGAALLAPEQSGATAAP